MGIGESKCHMRINRFFTNQNKNRNCSTHFVDQKALQRTLCFVSFNNTFPFAKKIQSKNKQKIRTENLKITRLNEKTAGKLKLTVDIFVNNQHSKNSQFKKC
jgi:hypothetical protein